MLSRREISEELTRSYRNFIHPIITGIIGGALFSVALERTIRLLYAGIFPALLDIIVTICLWCSSLLLFFPICWYLAKKVTTLIESFSFEVDPQSGLSIIRSFLTELKKILEDSPPQDQKHTLKSVKEALENIRVLLITGDMKKMWDHNKVIERKNQFQGFRRKLTEIGFQNKTVITSLKQLIKWFEQLTKLDKTLLDAFEKSFNKRVQKGFQASNSIYPKKGNKVIEIREKKFKVFNLPKCFVYFDSPTSTNFETPVECTIIYYSADFPFRGLDFKIFIRNSLTDAIMSDSFSPLYLKKTPSTVDLLHRISAQLEEETDLLHRISAQLEEETED